MSKLLEQINKEKRETTLGDVATFHRGYDLPITEIKKGIYPVVFSNGRKEFHDEFKVKGPGVFTGRSGSLGGMFYIEENYWPHNTTLYVSDFHGNDPKYCYYFLSSFDFSNYNAGTGVPTLNRNHIHGIPVKIPNLPTQKKIAEILSAYDAKIENNNKIIKNLEVTAQTIFKEWFIDFEFPSCGGVAEGRGGAIPRATQNYHSLPYNPKLKDRAKELRKAGNMAEVLLWLQFKNKQFFGLDFDRQKIIGNYIVDFYCANIGLVVEIDGSSHDDKYEYDKERDNYLKSLDLKVVHLTDTDVKKNMEFVLRFLGERINKPPRPIGTPPLEGNKYKSFGGKMIESEMGEIPERWKIKNVLEVIERIPVGKKFENKTASPIGKVPILDQGASGFIGYHNEEPGVVASIENPVVVFTNHTCYYRLLTEPFSCIQNVLPYIGKNGYKTLFVYFLTKEKIKMSEYKGHWPEFEQQVFVISPVELANTFVSKIKSFISEMVVLEKENVKLKQSRDQLLAKLI